MWYFLSSPSGTSARSPDASSLMLREGSLGQLSARLQVQTLSTDRLSKYLYSVTLIQLPWAVAIRCLSPTYRGSGNFAVLIFSTLSFWAFNFRHLTGGNSNLYSAFNFQVFNFCCLGSRRKFLMVKISLSTVHTCTCALRSNTPPHPTHTAV